MWQRISFTFVKRRMGRNYQGSDFKIHLKLEK
jgi:hypothetical protein